MSFSMNYLKYPLLPIHSHFKDALEINKCIFKLCELKRTRHTKEFLQERILVLLLGPNCILPMPSPSNDLTNDQKKNYETLKFFKEKKME